MDALTEMRCVEQDMRDLQDTNAKLSSELHLWKEKARSFSSALTSVRLEKEKLMEVYQRVDAAAASANRRAQAAKEEAAERKELQKAVASLKEREATLTTTLETRTKLMEAEISRWKALAHSLRNERDATPGNQAAA